MWVDRLSGNGKEGMELVDVYLSFSDNNATMTLGGHPLSNEVLFDKLMVNILVSQLNVHKKY